MSLSFFIIVKALFEEEDSSLRFPEFKDLHSNITDVTLHTKKSDMQRVTAFGCQNGYVRCCIVDALNYSKAKIQLVLSWLTFSFLSLSFIEVG